MGSVYLLVREVQNLYFVLLINAKQVNVTRLL